MAFQTRPLSLSTWSDLEELFAMPGGSIVRGCWCMYYRKAGRVAVGNRAGTDNKEELCALVEAGRVPGLRSQQDEAPGRRFVLDSRVVPLPNARSRLPCRS